MNPGGQLFLYITVSFITARHLQSGPLHIIAVVKLHPSPLNSFTVTVGSPRGHGDDMVYTERRFRPLLDKWRIYFLIEYATYCIYGREKQLVRRTMRCSVTCFSGLLCAEVKKILRKCTREANVRRPKKKISTLSFHLSFFSLSYIA